MQICLFSRGFGGISGRFSPFSLSVRGFLRRRRVPIASRGGSISSAAASQPVKEARPVSGPVIPSRCEHSTGAACQPGGRVMPARRVSGSPGFPCRIASPRPVRRVSGFAAASGGSQPDRRFPSPPINSGKMPAASTAARKNRRGAPRPDRPKNQHPLSEGTLYVPPLQRGRLTSVYRKTFRRTYEGLRLSPSQALQIRACCRLTRSPPHFTAGKSTGSQTRPQRFT